MLGSALTEEQIQRFSLLPFKRVVTLVIGEPLHARNQRPRPHHGGDISKISAETAFRGIHRAMPVRDYGLDLGLIFNPGRCLPDQVPQNAVPGYHRGKDDAAGFQAGDGALQRSRPVGFQHEMVQGTHQKNGVGRAAWNPVQRARIGGAETDPVGQSQRAGLFPASRYELIDEIHRRKPVSALRKYS